MVLLKSLKCGNCGNRCYPYFSSNQITKPKVCVPCNLLYCGQCVKFSRLKDSCRKRDLHSKQLEPCQQHLSVLAYFDKFAPADEMKLLSLRRWSPLYCRACSSPKGATENGNIFCRRDEEFYYSLEGCKQLTEYVQTKALCELNDLLIHDGRSVSIITKAPLFNSQECDKCGLLVNLTKVSFNGCFLCSRCRPTIPFLFFSQTECMFYFEVFLRNLPDEKDLNVLTYSKWTPLKCEKCSVVFSEISERIPVLDIIEHKIRCWKCTGFETTENFVKLFFLLRIILEFRSYFKNHGIDFALMGNTESIRTITTEPDRYLDKQSQVSSPSTKTTIPDTPRCHCGRYEEITEMKNCRTCNTSAVCTRCLVRDHWAHQITDTMPELFVEVVNNESEKIRRKLGNWRVRLEQTNSKGKEKFGDLVMAYETLFLKALESKEPAELHNLISLADFTELDDLLMETMTTNYKTFEKIDEFCAKLKGVPAKGNVGTRDSSAKRQSVVSTQSTATEPKSPLIAESEGEGSTSTQSFQAAEDGFPTNIKSNCDEENQSQSSKCGTKGKKKWRSKKQ